MRRRIAALALLASAAALLAGPRTRAEVRICRTLEEAVPRGGGPVLLVFFTTDCPSCYGDLFEARYFVDKAGWPVAVIGVFAGPQDELRAFLEKYAWTLPVVLDRRKVLVRKHDVDILPFKVLLAGDRAVYRDDPYAPYDKRWEALRSCLKKIFSR